MVSIEGYSTKTAIHTIEYEEDYFTKTGYQGYQDYPLNEIRTQKIIDMTSPKSVVDIGGAYGYIVKRLLDRGIHAVCMEVSHWCEKQKVVPDNFVRHDMRVVPYPFKDKEFDVLYCEGVLEHIGEEYIEGIMGEFERISHKRILALTFDWHLREAPYSEENDTAPGHLCIHNTNWWFQKIPDHSWLFIPPTGTQDSKSWLYKC